MILTKYVVKTTNSSTDFLNQSDADKYAIEVSGKVVVVEEEISDEKPYQENYEVALWRIKSILKLMGLESNVTAAIDGLPEPDKTVAATAWEYASNIERYGKTVLFVQAVLQLTDEQVEQIFEQAKGIDA